MLRVEEGSKEASHSSDCHSSNRLWNIRHSASGDLGYTYGNFEFHSKDKDGKASIQYGQYTSIWKVQKDGSWKVVLNMGNASPAPKK